MEQIAQSSNPPPPVLDYASGENDVLGRCQQADDLVMANAPPAALFPFFRHKRDAVRYFAFAKGEIFHLAAATGPCVLCGGNETQPALLRWMALLPRSAFGIAGPTNSVIFSTAHALCRSCRLTWRLRRAAAMLVGIAGVLIFLLVAVPAAFVFLCEVFNSSALMSSGRLMAFGASAAVALCVSVFFYRLVRFLHTPRALRTVMPKPVQCVGVRVIKMPQPRGISNV